jgi:DNA-binding beta-propeller fold protein YncE
VKGAPFIDPSGVAVGKDQTFVTDSSEEGTSLSSVIVVKDGKAETYLSSIKVGYPAGVALSLDEQTLYISGIDPDTGYDTVYVVEVATKSVQKFAKDGIETKVDALGLHRARNADVFSWSGANGTKDGTVFKITVKQ